MEYGTGCLICGEDVVYSGTFSRFTCFYCGAIKETNASCRLGHYVCDACHNAGANDLIERYCTGAERPSPLATAIAMMKNPSVKMHGPEHHFLVPAALLSAFHSATNLYGIEAAERIREARSRAEDVKGGFCGFQGACGAAIGAGIFMSIITGATPLSDRERQLSNLITAECLRAIAENGGERCCKRESLQTIIIAAVFVQREMGVTLPVDCLPPCPFTSRNRECIRERCGFFQGAENGYKLNNSRVEKM